jgi:2-dehydro-3-deoxy-D-arabinonate dehydratase
MTRIVRRASGPGEPRVGVVGTDGAFHGFPSETPTIGALLRLDKARIDAVLKSALARPADASGAIKELAPIDAATELWAAGVTFKRSEEARIAESDTPDIYARVYTAARPELFFKANARRVAGPAEPVVIRGDSRWDVPEAELAVVANAHGEIVAYSICNDVSSRNIEAENPLYLPQAKIWMRSGALGPALVTADAIADPYSLKIDLRILRRGNVEWAGGSSTSKLVRRFEDLIGYLFREDEFPDGVILSTGTGIVPPDAFTLEPGDVIEIEVDQVGVLRNPVVRGRSRDRGR